MDGGTTTTPEVTEAAASTPRKAAPHKPSDGSLEWAKKNLFGSPTSAIVTVLFGIIGYVFLRWFSEELIFSEERNWAAVWTNMRLLFAYTYPDSQFIRIWVSLGATLFAVGLTIGAFASQVRVSLRWLLSRFTVIGTGFIAVAVATMVDIFGLAFHAPDRSITTVLLIGLALLAIGLGLGQVLNVGRDDERTISLFALVAGLAGAVVLFFWLVPFGRYEFRDGEVIQESGTVATSTKLPWTIMMALLVGGYVVGLSKKLAQTAVFKLALGVWWVAGPAFLIFLVLRDPAFDWAHIWSTDLPMALGFALGGGALLYFISAPGFEEKARIIGAVLLVYAGFNWLTAFGDLALPFGLGTINWQWYPWASPPVGVEGTSMLQKARISFLLLAAVALLAPNFAGELKQRLRFAGAWVGFMLLMHWLITGINTPSTVEVVQPPFLGGFSLTLVIAYYVMLASFPVGIMMALARTSKMPIFRILSTGYIEFVRGVPLITVLFFFANIVNLFLPNLNPGSGMSLSDLAAVFIAYVLFSGAYMAENIRGGLQSIRRGQFEASDALGLTTVQRTAFIVLPQALRVSIPNLVGQAIATFKETSLIFIIGGFDFLRVANASIPSQPGFLGQNLPALLFISLVYWAISYAMSRGSRSLEDKLGVGTR